MKKKYKKIDVYNEINKILIKSLKISNLKSFKTNKSHYKRWDSLMHLKIIMEIEMKFKISFDVNEVFKFQNPDEIYKKTISLLRIN